MPLEEDVAELKQEVALLRAQFGPMVKRALREHEEAQRASATIDAGELAELLGARGGGATSLAELGRRRALRDPDLRALALVGGDGKSHWRWRRKDVVDLLAARRHERTNQRRG